MSDFKTRNLVDDFYGYNKTVSAMISKMCLGAYTVYEKEKLNHSDKVAMARAIGDTFKKNVEIFEAKYSMDRRLIENGYGENKDFLKHQEKDVFMRFCSALYDSGHYRVEKFNNPYEYFLKYQIAVFKIGELDNEKTITN